MNRRTLSLFSIFLMLTLYSMTGWASECEQDSDCPDGYACGPEESGPCMVPPCADGEECPDVQCDEAGYRACEPLPPENCVQDSDCESGLVCVTFEYQSCSGGGSVGGTEPACDPDGNTCVDGDRDGGFGELEPDDYTCEEGSESFCLPSYFAPCEVASDCGPGFTCEANSAGCRCSMPPRVDGEDTEPVDEVCECPEDDGNGEKYCQLEEMPCESDGDCTDDFECAEYGGGPDMICTVDPSGEGDCETEIVESEGQCVPPNFDRWFGGGANDGDYTSGPGAPRENDEATGGNAGQVGSDDDGQPKSSGGTNRDDGGCHVAPGSQGVPATVVLIGLMGLALAANRRRRG